MSVTHRLCHWSGSSVPCFHLVHRLVPIPGEELGLGLEGLVGSWVAWLENSKRRADALSLRDSEHKPDGGLGHTPEG